MDPINPIAGNPEALNPQPSVPKDSHGITIAAMAVFVLLALGAVAFLYYQNQQLKGLLAGYQTVQASPTPTATPDITANWNIYTSPSNSYSFKYPDGLKSDTGAAGSGFESIRFTFVGPAQIASGRTQTELFDGYFFAVTKLGATSQKDPKTEIEKAAKNSKENCTELSSVTNTMVAGQPAYQYSGNCLGTFTTTYLSDGKNTYSINELYTSDSYKLITDQILTTFQFTVPTSSPSAGLSCTFNGKTYKNGDSVPSTDNCNTCSCDNGNVACTTIACPATSSPNTVY